jgi:hypothetical protein
MRTILSIVATSALLTVLAVRASAEPPPGSAPVPTVPAIVSQMSVVTVDLSKTKTGEPVQTEQKRVLRDLDTLIAELEKQSERMGKGVNYNPRIPAPDSTIRRGAGGIGDLVDPRESDKDWAKLSTRERDRIIQSMSEGFPPEYRTVLERYYRRLAAEKTVPSGGASEMKASQPANP